MQFHVVLLIDPRRKIQITASSAVSWTVNTFRLSSICKTCVKSFESLRSYANITGYVTKRAKSTRRF